MPSNIPPSAARRNERRHHRGCQCISALFVSRQEHSEQWVGPRGNDCFSEKWAIRWQDIKRVQLQCDALEAARTVWGTCLVTDFTSCQQVWQLTVISRHLLSLDVSSSSASSIQVSTTFWLVSYYAMSFTERVDNACIWTGSAKNQSEHRSENYKIEVSFPSLQYEV